jgi:hypothetical protein
MTDLTQIIRDSGLLDALYPAEQLRHDAAIRTAVDAAGRITDDAAARLRPPEKVDWSTIDGRSRRTAQAGTLDLLWAHAETPPSSTCTVTFTLETKTQGATPIGSVTIAPGKRSGENANVSQPIPAGAYLNVSVTTAGGASLVSAGCVIKG